MFCHCGKDDVAVQPPRPSSTAAEYEAPKKVNREMSTMHYRVGLALAEEGKLKEAIACFKDACEFDNTSVDAHFMLASSCQEISLLSEALSYYQKVIRLQPSHQQAWYNAGYTYTDLGNDKVHREKAVRCFRKACELDPSDIDAQINLGLALKAAGLVSDAVQAYQQAIALDPKSICAHFNLGNLYSDMRNMDRAISCFKAGLEVCPGHQDCLFNLGIALQDRSCFNPNTRGADIREAIRCYDLVHTPEARAASAQLKLLLYAENTERELARVQQRTEEEIFKAKARAQNRGGDISPRRALQSIGNANAPLPVPILSKSYGLANNSAPSTPLVLPVGSVYSSSSSSSSNRASKVVAATPAAAPGPGPWGVAWAAAPASASAVTSGAMAPMSAGRAVALRSPR